MKTEIKIEIKNNKKLSFLLLNQKNIIADNKIYLMIPKLPFLHNLILLLDIY